MFAALADPSPIRAWMSADSAAPNYCLPIKSIACATGLASSTVSRAISGLVTLGLAERRQRGEGMVWGISLDPAIRSYSRIAGDRKRNRERHGEEFRAIRDDVRAPPGRDAKALRQREFSKSAEDGQRRIDRLGREAKRILALAGERPQRIAALIRATKALVAELTGDQEKGPRRPRAMSCRRRFAPPSKRSKAHR